MQESSARSFERYTDDDGRQFSANELIQAAYLAGDNPVFIIEWHTRRILACNQATERVFGYAPNELIGQTTRCLHIDDEHFRKFGEESEQILSQGIKQYHCFYYLRHRNGSIFATEHLVHVIHDGDGQPLVGISIVRNLGELLDSDTETFSPYFSDMHQLLSSLPGAVYQRIRTPAGEDRYTYIAGSLLEKYQLNSAAITKNPEAVWSRLHPEDREILQAEILRTEKTLAPFDLELRIMAQDEQKYGWLRAIAQPHRSDDGSTVWDGILLDITETKEAAERIQYLTTHDELTGLPNRYHFHSILQHRIDTALARHGRIAVIKLNLARTIYINEEYGYQATDQVIRQAGERLQAALPGDSLAARSHSDTFLVMYNVTDKDADLERIVNIINNVFAESFSLENGTQIKINANFGIAVCPADASDADGLMKAATLALDSARHKTGLSYQFYMPSLSEQVIEKSHHERDLRSALNNNQLLPYYQVQVSLTDGSLVGMEALARWPNDNGDMIPPAVFIPLAEEIGLASLLGESILGQIASQVQAWQNADLAVPPVAVNCSAQQLHSPDFYETIRRYTLDLGLKPDSIHIELTESNILDNVDLTRLIMTQLDKLGIRFSIDDFGTGYSSLNYLSQLPFHTLKIDRSFISKMIADSRNRSIMEALINIAMSLGMSSVAEGIETEEQLIEVKQLGCNAAQGFLIGKPMPAEDVEKFYLRDKGSLKNIAHMLSL